jgi:hypothetical protein
MIPSKHPGGFAVAIVPDRANSVSLHFANFYIKAKTEKVRGNSLDSEMVKVNVVDR